MTDLDKLIKAVEAGREDIYLWRPALGGADAGDGIRAFRGSLDAAKRLHDALLPGMSQYSIVTDPTCLCVKVAWWPRGLSGDIQIQGEGWDEGNPARAWLLAILRAVKDDSGNGAINASLTRKEKKMIDRYKLAEVQAIKEERDAWYKDCVKAEAEVAELKSQLQTVLDREAAAYARHDKKVEELEDTIEDYRSEIYWMKDRYDV